MSYVVVIPARYKSTRLPGKPLIKIGGVSMIERTYRQCVKAVPKERIVIATEDERVRSHCEEFGAKVIMTSSEHQTGTDRVASLLDDYDYDFFINVQGDEPILNPDDLMKIIKESTQGKHDIVNGYCKIDNEEQYFSRIIPKVVFSKDGTLLYMSRGPIPHNKEGNFAKAWRQVCIYGFSRKALKMFGGHQRKFPIEEIEDIEILRFLEMGLPVKMVELSDQSIAVDVLEDVKKVEDALKKYEN